MSDTKITCAVIMAAGEGSRMRPLTYTMPKVMLPLAGKPILEHLMIEMAAAGIRDFIFIVGYRNEIVRSYFGDGSRWEVRITFSNQMKQMGTADALRSVQHLVAGDFLVANGDVIMYRQDILDVMTHKENTLSLFRTDNVAGLGVVEVEKDRVLRIHEKTARPPSNLINAGVYRFTPEIFRAISRTGKSPRGEYELTDSIQILIDEGYPVKYHIVSEWLDLSYPWDLLTANEKFLQNIQPRNEGNIEPGVFLKDPIVIGENTLVRSGSYITGPVIIGKNCEIGPHCYIRPGTVIGDGCHIGASVEIKNSIIMSGSKVPHLSYVGDSIIGHNCNLGAGTKIANLRLDKQEISVNGINTHRRKLGAILGDNVQTGINVSINTGTLIGNDSMIGPGVFVSGVIAPHTMML